jgi:dTDP-4-dehydrorhamnose 3,5-epimerase
LNVEPLKLSEVFLIRPRVFTDARGYFLETCHTERYRAAGIIETFVQDNISQSHRGVLRGLHFQHPNAQGKLVMCMTGEIYDVAVDIRRGSPTFGQWTGCTLSATTHEQLYIPPGFAHGFCVLSESALVHYKCTALYDPKSEATLLYDDPDLAIDWPLEAAMVSDKDRAGSRLRDFAEGRLPSLHEFLMPGTLPARA